MAYYKFTSNGKSFVAGGISISTSILAKAAYEANGYLQSINTIFNQININFFEALGVTNISATVGEIFARFVCKQDPRTFITNPHPDGRPDILCMSSPEIIKYYNTCFGINGGKRFPIKDKFTPFYYGGIEIKCTVGTSDKSAKVFLKRNFDSTTFPVGVQRIRFLKDINWVAHHVQNVDLLGLYYDYIPECSAAPQIIAGFFHSLTTDSWNSVSHGVATAKTTSMTSIKGAAKTALKNNCVFMINNKLYQDKLNEIGVKMG